MPQKSSYLIRIFLAHAKEDKTAVMELYDRLKQKGYQPWLDKKDLIPGQNWRQEIPNAIKNSDIFIACLSQRSVAKQGFIQKEFRMALNAYAEKPPGTIYLIPLRLDDCQIPEIRQDEYGINLRDIHWLDYFEDDGFERLEQAIIYQFGQLESAAATAKTISTQDVPILETFQDVEPQSSTGQRRKDFYAKQLSQLEEELAVVEADLATQLSGGDRLKLERKIEQLLDKIDELETKLRELDPSSEKEEIRNPPIEKKSPPIRVNTKEVIPSPAFSKKLPDDVELEMIYVSGGEFMMGSPKNEKDRRDNEGPLHRVQVSPFYMGNAPVVQAQWRSVAGLNTIDRELDPDPSHYKGSDRPVEQVSWHDAVEFCKRLSNHTGRDYRLPSEAEWEYACRAGTTTAYSCGNSIRAEQANFGMSVGKTTSVCTYPKNAFGLYDMHGNVWEWCEDIWHGNYEGAPTDGSAWIANGDKRYRILRGGSWNDYPRDCRSASRLDGNPDSRDFYIGFRVVCRAPRT